MKVKATELAQQQVKLEGLEARMSDMEAADKALGRGGLQSFVLEGTVGELQSL